MRCAIRLSAVCRNSRRRPRTVVFHLWKTAAKDWLPRGRSRPLCFSLSGRWARSSNLRRPRTGGGPVFHRPVAASTAFRDEGWVPPIAFLQRMNATTVGVVPKTAESEPQSPLSHDPGTCTGWRQNLWLNPSYRTGLLRGESGGGSERAGNRKIQIGARSRPRRPRGPRKEVVPRRRMNRLRLRTTTRTRKSPTSVARRAPRGARCPQR